MGQLDGIFVAECWQITASVGKNVYFGEVLGKHSDISGTLEEGEVELISDNPSDVEVFERLDLATGYNPITILIDSGELEEDCEN